MLEITSLLFLSPAYQTYKKNHTLYTCSYVFLATASVLYHGTYYTIFFWIDQIAIYNIVLFSIYMAKYFSAYHIKLNLITLGLCISLYIFEKTFLIGFKQDLCHVLLHMIFTGGQHLVLENLPIHFDTRYIHLTNAS